MTVELQILPFDSACTRGFVLMIVSSLCLIHSESLQGFCHFHLNWTSHWWWLLFHLHSFPDCPIIANFFVGKCPMGTICTNRKSCCWNLKKKKNNKQKKAKQKNRPQFCNWKDQELTFRVWSMKAVDSLTGPLAMPAVYFSCFCAGTEIGDKEPFVASAKCFSELCEFPLS